MSIDFSIVFHAGCELRMQGARQAKRSDLELLTKAFAEVQRFGDRSFRDSGICGKLTLLGQCTGGGFTHSRCAAYSRGQRDVRLGLRVGGMLANERSPGCRSISTVMEQVAASQQDW